LLHLPANLFVAPWKKPAAWFGNRKRAVKPIQVDGEEGRFIILR